MKPFSANRSCWLAAVLVCGAALAFLLIQRTEPRYQGRTLGEWVADVPLPPYEDGKAREAVHAVRQIGTNALPFLLRQIQTRESLLRSFGVWLKKKQSLLPLSTRTDYQVRFDACLAIIALGPTAEPAVPELTRLLHVPELAADVGGILRFFGSKGYLALSTGLTNSNRTVRYFSAVNLVMVEAKLPRNATNEAVLNYRREANVAIPNLIRALDDPDPKVLHAVITALGYIRQEPEHVVPALQKFLTDTENRAEWCKSPRYAAKAAIKMFESEGRERTQSF